MATEENTEHQWCPLLLSVLSQMGSWRIYIPLGCTTCSSLNYSYVSDKQDVVNYNKEWSHTDYVGWGSLQIISHSFDCWVMLTQWGLYKISAVRPNCKSWRLWLFYLHKGEEDGKKSQTTHMCFTQKSPLPLVFVTTTAGRLVHRDLKEDNEM